MSQVIEYRRFWQRRDTPSAWAIANPILHDGEIGIALAPGESPTYILRMKIGDGVTAWNDLPWFGIGALPDPGVDALTFWDSTSGNWELLELGAGLSIVDRVLYAGATGGATAGDATTDTFVNYAGLTKTAGQWDGGTSAPTDTLRLNYDGYLYATRFYGDGSNLSGISGGAINTNTLPLSVQPFIQRGAWTFQWGVWGTSGAENSGIPTGGTAMGTLAAVTPASPSHSPMDLTKTFRRQPRRRYTSTAGAGANAGSRNSDVYVCGSGGYCYALRFGFADPAAVANARSFIGLRAATGAVANVNPSTFVDCVGVGADTGDANLQLMHNDGSGSCTKTDLGSNFPANTSDTDFYEIQILSAPGGTAIQVSLRNLTNGATDTRTVTTNMPAAATGLGYVFWRNNGTTALAVEIHFGSQSVATSLE